MSRITGAFDCSLSSALICLGGTSVCSSAVSLWRWLCTRWQWGPCTSSEPGLSLGESGVCRLLTPQQPPCSSTPMLMTGTHETTVSLQFLFFPLVACGVAPAQQEHVWSGSSRVGEGQGVLLRLVSTTGTRPAKMWAVDQTAVVHRPFPGYLPSPATVLFAWGEQRKLLNNSGTLSNPVWAGPGRLWRD